MVCIAVAPPPLRKFEIKFALRRIGILAGFAVCILTFAAPDAQAQTSCEAGERILTDKQGNSECFSNAVAALGDDCIAKNWDVTVVTGFGLFCKIPFSIYTSGNNSSNGDGCQLSPSPAPIVALCTDIFGDPLQLPQATGDEKEDKRGFVANCSQDGAIPGAIPSGLNMNGEKECSCSAPGYAGEWPDCIACDNGEGVLADGTCGVCPDLIENGICVACPFVGQVVNNGACVCPDNHTPFGGICIPDSPRDFGELSDAVLCEAFGGRVLQESLPQEAGELRRQVDLLAETTPAPPAAERAVYVEMARVIQAKFDRDSDSVDTFLSLYDTGGGNYNADAYSRIVLRANRAYGSGTFSDTKSNELARILARVPVQGPDKCIGANNSDALCILDDEADSAGVLPCQGQFQRLWACHNAGWSVSVNNGGSCGVLLTLAGGTTSDQCNLSGSASPQCADVFASTVHYFPSPTLSTDGATLRFVYNCDPNGSKGLIPATTNTIAATECTCPAGEAVQNGVCAACPSGQIVQNGVCAVACPAGQLIKSGVCAAPTTPEEKCTAAKWSYHFGQDACYINFKISGGSNQMACGFDETPSFHNYIPCEDVFGADYSLPFKPSGSNPVYVYNCDPNDESGLIPATVNTIGATDCTCPSGEGVLDNGSCGRCAAHHGVQNGACVRCSPGQGTLPNGTCGSCGVAGYALQNGVCVTCPEGQGIKGISPRCVSCDAGQVVQNNRCVSCGAGEIIQDGACVACPSGSIIDDGACVACTGGRIPVNNACACPTGAVLFGGVCTCPDGQGLLDNGSCGTCPPGKEVIDNVCAAPTVLMDLCEGAGWGFSASENSCGILLTLSGGAASDKCYLSGSTSPKCADVFASTVHYFPSPTLAADGATLRFVYNCDQDGESGLIPATANTIAATECGCESGASFFSDVCISDDGDLGLSDELLCGAFGGTVRTATGGREVCSGMDANDTFCIMDSAAGFPCRGLFKHLRSCNLEFNRKALNPFFCGENCGVQKAVGSECR